MRNLKRGMHSAKDVTVSLAIDLTNNGANGVKRILSALLILCISTPAHSYGGPGAGIAFIGTLISLIGIIAIGGVGFLWYPIKRLLKRNEKEQETDEQ
ncbi:hypothetical protein GRI89_12230 [Altererythrobacter salegens]|uniref:Uncharacterized protein n=1 Tax=Croceibacterium salegens TaxID=1737568 RepID=A0A6I4SZP0_9SPHN|nr:hypothetical protein [Croceibacterium salegens]MXO60306.1 hypothetical protein [Croceibacterium salegens]